MVASTPAVSSCFHSAMAVSMPDCPDVDWKCTTVPAAEDCASLLGAGVAEHALAPRATHAVRSAAVAGPGGRARRRVRPPLPMTAIIHLRPCPRVYGTTVRPAVLAAIEQQRGCQPVRQLLVAGVDLEAHHRGAVLDRQDHGRRGDCPGGRCRGE